MNTRAAAASAFLVFALGPGCNKPGAAPAAVAEIAPLPEEPASGRVAGWRGDIEYLTAEIRRQHYVYRSQPLPAAFVRRSRELTEAVPRFSDERMLFEVQGLMSELGDGHSFLRPVAFQGRSVRCLPVQLYLFSDGLFVVDTEPGYERWLGRRILRLGPVPAAEAMRRAAAFPSRDNEMGVAWMGPFFLRFRGMLEALGLEPGAEKVRLVYRTEIGGEEAEDLGFIPSPWFGQVPKLGPPRGRGTAEPPLYLRQVSTPYWFERLGRPGEDTLYLQFNQVWNGPESLAAFSRRLEGELAERPPARLVVDVRHNDGGNADLLPPLVAALAAFEVRRPDAKLVVLTGRNTFSAAQIFISQLDRATRAEFAGEMSSSKPNFVGETNEVVLPWSRAAASISDRYHESIPGDRRQGIAPDLKVEVSSADYFGNRDPVLDAVRRNTGPG